MFRRLRDALDRALSRMEGGEVTREEIDRVLAAMREELIERKAGLPSLEANIAALERERDAERQRAETSVRRAAQAERIGDAETVEVAERFARQHLGRMGVLEQKIEVARSELAFEREEVARMTAELKDAMAKRDTLAIQSRRAGAMGRAHGAGREILDDFERMADRVERPGREADARRELDEALGGRPADRAVERELERSHREAEADAMLRELKRRMGMEE